MDSQWARSRDPVSCQALRRSSAAITRRSSRWAPDTFACSASPAVISWSSFVSNMCSMLGRPKPTVCERRHTGGEVLAGEGPQERDVLGLTRRVARCLQDEREVGELGASDDRAPPVLTDEAVADVLVPITALAAR